MWRTTFSCGSPPWTSAAALRAFLAADRYRSTGVTRKVEQDTSVLFEERVEPGASWSHVLKRGTALRLTDLEGSANAGVLLYNFECTVERYNMPDTLKAQHIARLTKGFVLYSDMGRILC